MGRRHFQAVCAQAAFLPALIFPAPGYPGGRPRHRPSWCPGTKVTPRALCASTPGASGVCHWGNVWLCPALAVLG